MGIRNIRSPDDCLRNNITFMKTRRLFLVFSLSSVCLFGVAPTACRQSSHSEKFQDFPALVSAIQAFSGDLTRQGKVLPPSVALGELVGGGYLSSNAVRAFEGMETRVWFGASPGRPETVMMSARLPNGMVNVLLSDGSVRQYPAEKFAEHLKRSGQDGAAGGSQPTLPGRPG
jgi:hypothetical protein